MKKYTTSQRIKELMDSRGLRQIDILRSAEPFCSLYGIRLGKNDLSQYVSGKVVPGQDKLTILGLALNVSEAWLMGYDVPPNRSVLGPEFALSSSNCNLFSPLKNIRESLGYSPSTVALNIGISVDEYLRIEAGENTYCSVLVNLANFLHCSTDDILSNDWQIDGVNPVSDISINEKSLLTKFRTLNLEGQEKVLCYSDDLIRAEIYKNSPNSDSIPKKA